MKIAINHEQLDKLSLYEAIQLHDYIEKAIKDGYYSAKCDNEYYILVKHELRGIIMEWTSLIFSEV